MKTDSALYCLEMRKQISRGHFANKKFELMLTKRAKVYSSFGLVV